MTIDRRIPLPGQWMRNPKTFQLVRFMGAAWTQAGIQMAQFRFENQHGNMESLLVPMTDAVRDLVMVEVSK